MQAHAGAEERVRKRIRMWDDPEPSMILKQMIVHSTDEKTEALKDLFAVTQPYRNRGAMSYAMGKS